MFVISALGNLRWTQGQVSLDYISRPCVKKKINKEGKERKESNAKEYMKCSSNKQLLKLGIKKIAYSSTTLETVTEDYKFKVNSKMEDWSNELVGKN